MLWQGEQSIGLRASLLRCMTLLNLVPLRPTVSTLVEVMPQVFSTLDEVSNVSANFYSSPYYIVKDERNGNLLVVAGGFDAAVQDTTRLFSGWITRDFDRDRLDGPYAQQASDIAAQVGAENDVPWNQITLIGHSFGGAALTSLAAVMPDFIAGSQVPFRLYTFGAPKPFRNYRMPSYSGIIYRRCFAADDPVPSIPPPLANVVPVVGAMNYLGAHRWADYAQWGAGFQLNPNASGQWEPNPSAISSIQLPFRVASWLTGNTAFGAVTHSLQGYNALVSSMPDDSPIRLDTPPPRVRTPPTQVTPSEFRVLQDTNAALQSSIVQGNPQQAADNIRAAFPAKPGLKFRGHKFRGHRAILYGADLVTYVHSRRAQISLVRYLNKQIGGGASGVSLVQSLAP